LNLCLVTGLGVGGRGDARFGDGHISTTVVARIIMIAPIKIHVHENDTESSSTFHNRGAVYVQDDEEYHKTDFVPVNSAPIESLIMGV
jgi:hypothetical protein